MSKKKFDIFLLWEYEYSYVKWNLSYKLIQNDKMKLTNYNKETKKQTHIWNEKQQCN